MKKHLKTILLIFIFPIITGIISGVITAKIQDINFLEALWLIIKVIFNFFLNLLTFKIPLWIILIIIFVIIGIIKILIIINDSKNKIESKKMEIKKVFQDYTEDYYDDIKYRWNWYESYDGVQITNLHPICECGCDLEYDMFDSYIICPDCKKRYKNTVDENSAERVFGNRYRKKLEKYIKEHS